MESYIMEEDSLKNDVWKVIFESGHLDSLKNMWSEFGYDSKSISERHKVICDHIQEFLEQIVNEEEDNKQKLLGEIKEYLATACTLSEELKINMEYDDHQSLLEVREVLCNKIQCFKEIKQNCMHSFFELKKQEAKFCDALGITPLTAPASPVPTEVDLATFQKYVQNKNKEKERLLEIYLSTREAVEKIMAELDIKPQLEFEKHVMSDEYNFQLTEDNMSKLKELHQSLEGRLEDTKALTVELWGKLSLLWERLREPSDVRDAFVIAHVGHSAKALKALKEEIKRCDTKKRLNMETFVMEERQKLEALWDKCLYSSTQKLAFSHFYTENYTEDLLELHEREVEKMNEFYGGNHNIFLTIQQHQDLWHRKEELENNPGTQLNGTIIVVDSSCKKRKNEIPYPRTWQRLSLN